MTSLRILTAALFIIAASSTGVWATDPPSDRVGPDTTVSFKEKQTQLTANAKDRLDALVKHAQMNGNVDEIQVAVWSDNPAPRHDEQLSKDDRTLADLRGSEIAKYVKRHGNAKVVVYNMAERSSWLAKAFDTADAELKYEIGHDYKTMSKQEFQIFRDNGKPSKAVVLVVMKR